MTISLPLSDNRVLRLTLPRIQRYDIPDPPLTEFGEQQCAKLALHFEDCLPLIREVSLVVASPMRRTIQTAQICLASVLEKGVPMVLRGEWQEVSAKPCDHPVPVSATKALFPAIPEAAYAGLMAPYPEKTGIYAFTPPAVLARGEACLAWLKARPEKVIAVVSHSGFLRVGIANRGFANGDYRVFDFVDGDELKASRSREMDDRPGLLERDITRGKGGLKTSWEGRQGVESQVWPEGSSDATVEQKDQGNSGEQVLDGV